MPIVWSKEYSIGVEEIDSQHKKLLVLINRLEMVAATSVQNIGQQHHFKEKVHSILQELVNYTILHFSTEEVLMKMFDYQHFQQHKQSHDNFVTLIQSKQVAIESLIESQQYDEAIHHMSDIYHFLQNWLLNHILKSDAQYTKFFLAIKQKARKSGGWLSFLGR